MPAGELLRAEPGIARQGHGRPFFDRPHLGDFQSFGHDNILLPVGVAFSVIGGCMLIICGFVYLRGPAAKLRHSEMIITPSGLALVQGDLQGELTWAEVLTAKKYGNGLRLKVAGAEIIIQNVYQWPLEYALRQIDAFRDNYRP